MTANIPQIAQSLVGVVLVVFAIPLSLRYNAWTTKVRQRQNRAPSPEMRANNTQIFAWILRIFGAFLLVLSALVNLERRS